MHRSKPVDNTRGPKPLVPFIDNPPLLNVLPTVRIGFEHPPTTSTPGDVHAWTGTRVSPKPAASHSGPQGRQLNVQPAVMHSPPSQVNDADLRVLDALIHSLKSSELILRPDDAGKKKTVRPRADHPPLFMYRFAEMGRLPKPTGDLSSFDMRLLTT